MRASATVSGAALTATTNANGKATTTRRAVTPRAAAVSRVGFDGAKTGDSDLTLRVARAEVAKGLVHKYVVMVRQNARRVSATTTTRLRRRRVYDLVFSLQTRARRRDEAFGRRVGKVGRVGHARGALNPETRCVADARYRIDGGLMTRAGRSRARKFSSFRFRRAVVGPSVPRRPRAGEDGGGGIGV